MSDEDGGFLQSIESCIALEGQEDEILADGGVEDDVAEEEADVVMCVLFKNAKMSASYYSIKWKVLHFVEELIDFQPHYSHVLSLLREIKPVHVVTMGSPFDDFTKALIDMMSELQGDASSHNSHELRAVPSNMSLLPHKEYVYVLCEQQLKSLHLKSEPIGLNHEEHQLHLQSIVNFQQKLTVHALGALVKFMERHWHQLKGAEEGALLFYDLQRATISDHVLIDAMTFSALQVFKTMSHDAGYKRGSAGASREGTSLFRLLSQHCKSKLGPWKLRNLMVTPTNNANELKKRLDFIEFVQCPSRQGFVDSLLDVVKNVCHVNTILAKIQHSKGTQREWKTLHTTIFNVLYLNEFCSTYRDKLAIFAELDETVTACLYGLERSIFRSLDFEHKTKNNKPAIKVGLDADLDEKKMMKEDIGRRVAVAARIVVEQLPSFLTKCVICFIPDMGHVVSIKRWAPDCDPRSLQDTGFQYMFELNGNFHYKNAICQEMDAQLGNLINDILEHEYRIIERLATFVVLYNNHIRQPLEVVATIDCLISVAKVASERGYVRPVFNDRNVIEIVGGRHPLMELSDCSYVANDFRSGGGRGPPTKIITGPNSSGKTIFLKQTALLAYLAHVGCYVPASSANVTLLHSIHSRMHATESALLNLSAFAIDVTQMARALFNARHNSLVLLDEFGRGTLGDEGLALLLGAVRKFQRQGAYCPHLLVSTHLDCPPEMLDPDLTQYLTMDHTRDPDTNGIVFLHRVIEGKSCSYGLEIAQSVHLPPDLCQRARLFLDNPDEVSPLAEKNPAGYGKPITDKFLRSINLCPLDG